MLVESLAIIAVILILAFMALRSGKLMLAGLTVPLISLSVLHLLGLAALQLARLSASAHLVLLAAHVLGLLAGLVLCVAASRRITASRIRFSYRLFSWVFLFALFAAYRLNL